MVCDGILYEIALRCGSDSDVGRTRCILLWAHNEITCRRGHISMHFELIDAFRGLMKQL